MQDEERDQPWWETGAPSEPALSPNFRKHRTLLITAACGVFLALVGSFVRVFAMHM